MDKENINEEKLEKKRNAEAEEKKRQNEIEERRKIEEAERLKREEAEKQKRLEEEAQQRLEEEKEAKRLEEIEINKRLKNTVEKLEDEALLTKYNNMMEEIVEVKSDKNRLISKVDALSKRVLTKKALIEDNKKVKYYTGLPSFSVLDAIYALVTKGLPDSNFDQFLMTLMKLQLNCGEESASQQYPGPLVSGLIYCSPSCQN